MSGRTPAGLQPTLFEAAEIAGEGGYWIAVRDGMALAWQRWPGERLYTYVAPGKVKSPNPGWCFQCAGWRRCGHTQRGLHILECRPEWTREG